eukprot:TRINITY_DN3184_c0_g1_i7.p1 TRINITY_DN3184_c0_g1~~TRINITY_DN3184_c0_g1_i7.p1  ORF type:complete len:1014 (+),score=184.13 TRINITY_DN3184_c0_g1_i7:105-3146(+)
MANFAAQQFEQRMKRALEQVKVVLEANKKPCFASGVHHEYKDKYLLVETLVNTAAASQLNCLGQLGMTADHLKQLCEWASTHSVSLRWETNSTCSFLRKEEREVESPTKHTSELTVGGVVASSVTHKAVTKVTEWFWNYQATFELLAFRGVGAEPADRISLMQGTGATELKTTTESSPYPASQTPRREDFNITWLVRQLKAGSSTPSFTVNRSDAKCHTPVRNPDSQAAGEHFRGFRWWIGRLESSVSNLLRVEQPATSPFGNVNVSVQQDNVLVPVIPLMQDAIPAAAGAGAATDTAGAGATPAELPAGSLMACLARSGADSEDSPVLNFQDFNKLLQEEIRVIIERRKELEKAMPQDSVASRPPMKTAVTAMIHMLATHMTKVCIQLEVAVDYVEGLLRQQLVAAIGKEVTPADFQEYMTYDYRKYFRAEYAPRPFVYAVRRSARHSPEGSLSLEDVPESTPDRSPGGASMASPIFTMTAVSEARHDMTFPINASTNITFGGERHLHAYLSHQFSGQAASSIRLVARARQFSSFLVLVGNLSSATTFDPKYAAIVQNKDELSIPLDLSTIPTPKEFKDAIQSLSPEQQGFAKAFRAMQLESTLFGILVVQIRPQLETVLNLAPDSLTKEIKLTSNLMQLFTKYQIPTDLLAFDGTEDEEGMEIVTPTASDRLMAVRGHVQAMLDMIEAEKQEEVEQAKQARQYARHQFDACGGSEECAERGIRASIDSCSNSLGSGLFGGSAKGGGRSMRFGSATRVALGGGPPPPPCAPTAWGCDVDRGMDMDLGCAVPVSAPVARSAPRSAQAFSSPSSAISTGYQQQAQQQQPQPGQQGQSQQQQQSGAADVVATSGRDYTQVPKELDAAFEKLDPDNALRPTIIKPGSLWAKKSQKALLAQPTTSMLSTDEQKTEKDAAFDLLDALTKSGALPLQQASLHIVVAATHCFDKSITDTVVQGNVNPIEKVERSSLIMASTIHRQPVWALVQPQQRARIEGTSSRLFLEDELAATDLMDL